MPLPSNPLVELKVDQLKGICRDLGLPFTGNKNDLISRILEHDPDFIDKMEHGLPNKGEQAEGGDQKGEPSKMSGVDSGQVMMMLMTLLQKQEAREAEERRRQDERDQRSEAREERLLRLLSDGRGVDLPVAESSRSNSFDRLGQDPQAIGERFEWQFSDVEWKLAQLDKDLSENVPSAACKQSLVMVEKSEERLSSLIGEKLAFLADAESQGFTERYQEVRTKIYNKRRETIIFCQSKDDQDKAGGLPAGVQVPEFLGDPNDFPSWLESFEALVHGNPKVSRFYKYRYLKQALKGAAQHCLAGFSPMVDQYESALEHVKSRFGQPRKVFRHVVKSIVDMAQLSSNSAVEIRHHYDVVQGKLFTLKRYAEKIENPLEAIIIPILESKLTPELKRDWEKELVENFDDEEFATMDQFTEWYAKQVRSRETMTSFNANTHQKNSPKSFSSKNEKPFSGQALTTGVTRSESAKKFCVVCGGAHSIRTCHQFKKETVDRKWEIAREKRLCFSCLEEFCPNHSCEYVCRATGCGKKHSRLLHFERSSRIMPSVPKPTADRIDKEDASHDHEPTHVATSSCVIGLRSKTTVMPSVIAYLRHGSQSVAVRVAFDSMCQETFVSERVSNLAHLKPTNMAQFSISGFGEKATVVTTGRVPFGLSRTSQSKIIKIDGIIKPGKICAALEPIDIDWTTCSHLQSLDLAESELTQGGEVDVLIGLNHYLKLVEGTIIRHPERMDLPAALSTAFGFVIFGPVSRGSVKRAVQCMFTQVRDIAMDENLERFWKLDAFGMKDDKRPLTGPEREAMDILEKSIHFNDGRYSVALPFKRNAPPLKSSFEVAKRQLISIENRLSKCEDKKVSYQKAMKDYVDLGFSRLATPEEVDEFKAGPEFIIPHHPVERKESVSTKTRVVFNASMKNSNGISLNDCLLTGPALQPDLGQILLRFRTCRIALLGDIAKMFCQTKIHSKHFRYQQYLWRNFDRTAEPQRYIMTRVMFGVTPSPFLAIGSVQHHVGLLSMKEKFPQACKAVLQDMYVDDYCGGGDTVEEVQELCQQLIQLLHLGGWHLTKFVSNSQEVMDQIPVEDRLLEKVIELHEQTDGATKALGIGWHVNEDVFCFKISDALKDPLSVYTKRTILSKVSQVFDVLGFYTAFTIRGKMIIQDLWASQCKWDERLSGELVEQFRKWENELLSLDQIQIPRVVLPWGLPDIDLQLHIFSDASEKAYAASVYVRSEMKDGSVTAHLLLSKARVAPLKRVSVPRLELLGAHLGAKLAKHVLDALKLQFSRVCFWTDSEIVLYWVSRPSSSWKVFVANRVQDIHDVSQSDQWSHVRSEDNPADAMSRGISVNQMKESSLYWNGPEWLKKSETDWPHFQNKGQFVDAAETEAAKKVVALTVNLTEDVNHLFERFEKYAKIIRVFVFLLLSCRKIPRTASLRLSAEQFASGERVVLRLVQRLSFPDDYESLKNGQKSSKSQLLALDPLFDESTGLLVVGGRLNLSSYGDEFKHQIILPSNHPIVLKLIMHVHLKECHSGPETTLCCLRQRFWIVKGRRSVSKVVRSCRTCRRHQTVPCQQKMAPLPPERMEVAPAFTNVGLDFTGPLFVKGEDLSKVYVCIFTCAQSRMVHFELVRNMETGEFLQAFRRMTNRRGMCQLVISDNQTTFKKAARVLREAAVSPFCNENGIQWNFITERSPFRGGFYERLNQSLKKPLKKILGKSLVTLSELYTIITDIESSINQRPLTYQSPEVVDKQALTPAHLALGRPLAPFPFLKAKECSLGQRFTYIERLLTHFWKRWAEEYLPRLQIRSKWRQQEPQLNLNDIVLVSEDHIPRRAWPIGRVTELCSSMDGLIRTVKVQTAKGIYARPVQRLHLLEAFKESGSESSSCRKNGAKSPLPISDVRPHSEPVPVLLRDPAISQGGEDVGIRSKYGRIIKKPCRFQCQ